MNFITQLRMLIFAGTLSLSLTACGDTETAQTVPKPTTEKMDMKLEIQVGDRTLTSTLYDNATAKDLIAQLPLTLTLTDYNGAEKIANPPKRLSTTGAPDGFEPKAGDIAYYAPWGNLAIFYRDFRHSQNLIRLGKIDGDNLEAFQGSGEVKVTFRMDKKSGESK